MSILAVIITIVIVGLVLWAINTYVPLDQKIKTILNVVVVIFMIVWLLKILGAWAYLGSTKLNFIIPWPWQI